MSSVSLNKIILLRYHCFNYTFYFTSVYIKKKNIVVYTLNKCNQYLSKVKDYKITNPL